MPRSPLIGLAALLALLVAAACAEPDTRSEVQKLVDDGSAAAGQRLLALYRRDDPDTHDEAARGIVTLAQAALKRGDEKNAADWSLHVYLSSAPDDARLEALRTYVTSGGAKALPRLAAIVDGRLDRDYLPHLPEMLAGIPGSEARALEARLARIWGK